MKSHEYAGKMRELASFLESRPEFDTGTSPHIFLHFYDKEQFTGAVRALGTGKKEITDGVFAEVKFRPIAAPEVCVSIARDKVCRKVQDVCVGMRADVERVRTRRDLSYGGTTAQGPAKFGAVRALESYNGARGASLNGGKGGELATRSPRLGPFLSFSQR